MSEAAPPASAPPPALSIVTAFDSPVVDTAPAAADDGALPIEAAADRILRAVERDRVTVVTGGTATGKSTRVPVMLLRDAEAAGARCKIMVVQPSDVAASR